MTIYILSKFIENDLTHNSSYISSRRHIFVHQADLLEHTCLKMRAGMPGGDSPQANLWRSNTSEVITNYFPTIISQNAARFFPIHKYIRENISHQVYYVGFGQKLNAEKKARQ